ncbi:DegT/DnrJ/EryC1/StrS family aminotransferase [Curvivirga aplysinae]|uniref:DegT/DnrJ/EryC1/StrS family aminotransferase n=1 Tax=Curvivirga aplysinae TaxID=2529852 RepID=UPI0012BC7CC6|nr:DegT/DnrJ/EryC1/StrS family aminotransferase [Curvivirga aplysinae]MTI08918.1 DegT/DnrJ/EryC1/StrS family aminotransferase [Curvivirga aplysinae]
MSNANTAIIPLADINRAHEAYMEDFLEITRKVISRGQFILGPEVSAFEKEFATYIGATKAIGVGNGTDALILALRALGIGVGDEVITVSNSFLASVSCIELVGAKAVFVDIGVDFNMNPTLIEGAITDKTKAIIAVHLTGTPADLDPILDVASRHSLYVIEDCAQAVGATYKGRFVGSLGDVGCFSLHPNKTLNAFGDGGIITTNNEVVYASIIADRNHGLTQGGCHSWGMNSRLDELQAAICRRKLELLDDWNEQRRVIAQRYIDGLCDFVTVPSEQEEIRAVYHTFIIRTEQRDALALFLKERGIETRVHYEVPVHQQPVLQERQIEFMLPITESYAETILTLPLFVGMEDQEIDHVIKSIQLFFKS